MTNIIRPNFGGRTREAEPFDAAAPYEECQPLRVYGTEAGHLVSLIQDTRGPEGRCLKDVIGAASKNTIEAVAVMPASDEGRDDADMTAMAVLSCAGDR
jgi:hypothetical protein